jgi:hypothetical protein
MGTLRGFPNPRCCAAGERSPAWFRRRVPRCAKCRPAWFRTPIRSNVPHPHADENASVCRTRRSCPGRYRWDPGTLRFRDQEHHQRRPSRRLGQEEPARVDDGLGRTQEDRLRDLQQDQAQRRAQGRPAHPHFGGGGAGEVRAAQDLQAARRRLHVQALGSPRADAKGEHPRRPRRARVRNGPQPVRRDLPRHRCGVLGNRHRRRRHRRRIQDGDAAAPIGRERGSTSRSRSPGRQPGLGRHVRQRGRCGLRRPGIADARANPNRPGSEQRWPCRQLLGRPHAATCRDRGRGRVAAARP